MRIFAVVDVAAVTPLVNARGAAVISVARHSLDGSKILLDFNHHRGTIDGLFLPDVDVDAVIAGCQMLNHTQALMLMDTPEWHEEDGL